MSEPTVVLAAVVERSGTYLLCQRSLNKRHGGLWEFPGGKLEEGESLHDAAKRELWEELELEVTGVGHVIAVIEDEGSQFKILFVFVYVPPCAIPTLLEHEAFAWVPRREVCSYSLAPSDAKFACTLL